jgi:arylsulfatase A-like enzyme
MPVKKERRYRNRMPNLKNIPFTVLAAPRFKKAAGVPLTPLQITHSASYIVHKETQETIAPKFASHLFQRKSISILAVLLMMLSIGCGSASKPAPVVNRPPTVVNPGSQTGLKGQSANLKITASDLDGNTLQYSATGLPTSLTINSGTGIITGIFNQTGNFAIAVVVSDGQASARAEFSWTVAAPPNFPPVAIAQTVFTGFNASRTIVLSGSDLNNDPLTYNIVANPKSGNLSGTPPNLTYTPNSGFSGTDSFKFNVRDSEYQSNTADVSIIVRPNGMTAPNILLVIMDDVGMDTTTQMHPGMIDELTAQYGPQGYNNLYYRRIAGRPASIPKLNTLAQQGMVFSQTWVQPYCSPTRASILTGLYAAKTNVFDYADPLSQSHQTVARILRDQAGYSTAIFGKWHVAGLGVYPGMKPKQAGFDLFRGNLNGAIDEYWNYDYQIQDATTPPNQWRTETPPLRSLPGIAATTYAPVVKVADAIDWITEQENTNPNKPWFTWFAFNLSHIAADETAGPTFVPNYDTLDETTRNEILACGGTFGTSKIGACSGPALNRAMTNSLDTLFGKLIEAVDRIDPYTYIIVLGDNGTPMYGQAALNFIDNMYITRAGRGKGTTYESGVRVSMAIRGPGITAGRRSAAVTHGTDLFATILDLAGATVPTTVPNSAGTGIVALDSVSLAPAIFSDADQVHDPNYAYIMSETVNPLSNNERQAAARDATYKLLCKENTQTASCSFFNLVNDPLEEYPVSKPGSCFNFKETWTLTDSAWHFCNLQNILSTQSFLKNP